MKEVKKIPFPKCYECCSIAYEFGASICQDECPEKFRKDGEL